MRHTVAQRNEARIAVYIKPPRPRQIDIDHLMDPPALRGHHNRAVSEVNRFFDIVGHEQNGFAVRFPKLQQEVLHE